MKPVDTLGKPKVAMLAEVPAVFGEQQDSMFRLMGIAESWLKTGIWQRPV